MCESTAVRHLLEVEGAVVQRLVVVVFIHLISGVGLGFKVQILWFGVEG